MARKKRKLTREEEFSILKLVLDKFLWAGLLILLYGFYHMIEGADIRQGFWIMAGGAVVLVLFIGVLIKEYEILQ